MTPQLVDHAHIDSCIVIGCNVVQPRSDMNTFISGRSHITVVTVNNSLAVATVSFFPAADRAGGGTNWEQREHVIMCCKIGVRPNVAAG